MTGDPRHVIPEGASSPVDVYKNGLLAAHMWRVGEVVTLEYRPDYGSERPPLAFSLPLSSRRFETDRMRIPAFFAGLLPEGESRRRDLQRAFHLAEDDQLGLLALIGADTVGDVQVVPSSEPLADAPMFEPRSWAKESFRELWENLEGTQHRSALPGVQPKMSARLRSLVGGATGGVILKLPFEKWEGVLSNELFFMSHAPGVGLRAPKVRIVTDRCGEEALEVVRFDRTVAEGRTMRHAQEDACQILGLRPGQKYDPDARTIVRALASRCASPKVAARDLFHQLIYSYAIGNNDVHAKNLSIHRDPSSSLWVVTPVYDLLHTWPYEADHRFWPAIREDGPHDAVTLKHWLGFARDIDLPEKVAARLIDRVRAAVPELVSGARTAIAISEGRLRDLERVMRKRERDLLGG